MLGGQPLTDMVSSKQTRTARLWIRRVLVRSQEGQLTARDPLKGHQGVVAFSDPAEVQTNTQRLTTLNPLDPKLAAQSPTGAQGLSHVSPHPQTMSESASEVR